MIDKTNNDINEYNNLNPNIENNNEKWNIWKYKVKTKQKFSKKK